MDIYISIDREFTYIVYLNGNGRDDRRYWIENTIGLPIRISETAIYAI